MSVIIWARRAVRDLRRAAPEMRRRIIAAIDAMVETGQGDIRRLADVHPPEFRLRVGEWRVRFSYDAAGAVVILRVLPRDKAYK